jgi:hypothetical protein
MNPPPFQGQILFLNGTIYKIQDEQRKNLPITMILGDLSSVDSFLLIHTWHGERGIRRTG